MYENKPISGSHVVDLVNDLLRQRKGLSRSAGPFLREVWHE